MKSNIVEMIIHYAWIINQFLESKKTKRINGRKTATSYKESIKLCTWEFFCNFDKGRWIYLFFSFLLQNYAETLVKYQLSKMHENNSLLYWSVITRSDYNRHNTWDRRRCICQILERNPELIKKLVNISDDEVLIENWKCIKIM